MPELTIDIYSDGANIEQMKEAYQSGKVTGFTTNPSLMKQAGITDYTAFAEEVVATFPEVPVSFEVFADDFETMAKEADKIASFGSNVYVKIPITNTKGESAVPLIKELSEHLVKVNVTAVFTLDQVKAVVEALADKTDSIVSVFAGRIADAGIDPIEIMKQSADICHQKRHVKLLWASSREVLNMIQAQQAGADIITCTPDLIKKSASIGKDLEAFSLETVQMFHDDIQKLGYQIL
ncbi:transaldolase [Amphibacillus sediminis]|uniref:transaldolase n=1 Tax=Amphibacillus sediminis TaxID=360185 RepID=UPI00082D8BF9|nr:transaldolase [Amphibacillus sediminis]